MYNAQIYKIEYDSIKRNLTFTEKRGPEPKENESIFPTQSMEDIDNMMIMDYEVYRVKLNRGKIDSIVKHSNNSSSFDIESIAKSILNEKYGLKIGNLYNTKYSYNYSNDSIVILNTKKINNRLLLTLLSSITLLIIFEIVIYYVSKVITKRITKPAEEAFNKQKDFIADASHELKTPLAVIMASADELKSDKKNNKYIESIKYESDRMSTLIKSLLDLSKLEKGVSINSYKQENISKIIERTCLTFEAIAFEEKIKIKTNIEEKIMFKCSMDEIERLISIILDNAIKHSYKNSTINVLTKKEKNTINIEITNSGDPIKDGDEEKIFERFYRGDKSRNREANRYGLGLAIAKNIVTNHNGNIRAFSKNKKTTFKIIFKEH